MKPKTEQVQSSHEITLQSGDKLIINANSNHENIIINNFNPSENQIETDPALNANDILIDSTDEGTVLHIIPTGQEYTFSNISISDLSIQITQAQGQAQSFTASSEQQENHPYANHSYAHPSQEYTRSDNATKESTSTVNYVSNISVTESETSDSKYINSNYNEQDLEELINSFKDAEETQDFTKDSKDSIASIIDQIPTPVLDNQFTGHNSEDLQHRPNNIYENSQVQSGKESSDQGGNSNIDEDEPNTQEATKAELLNNQKANLSRDILRQIQSLSSQDEFGKYDSEILYQSSTGNDQSSSHTREEVDNGVEIDQEMDYGYELNSVDNLDKAHSSTGTESSSSEEIWQEFLLHLDDSEQHDHSS